MRPLLMATAVLCAAAPAFATPQEFCAGFAYGYESVHGVRSAQGNRASLPACPAAQVALNGVTDFRDGVRAGIAEAERRPLAVGLNR
jgi:hypothetical protein